MAKIKSEDCTAPTNTMLQTLVSLTLFKLLFQGYKNG